MSLDPPLIDEHALRRTELKKFQEHRRCPACGSEVESDCPHERDSSSDVHSCTQCPWFCTEMELWELK
jgi:transcription elongation factor Elf1